MEEHFGHNSRITLASVLPLICKNAPILSDHDMSHIRLVSRDYAQVINEHRLQLSLHFESVEDVCAGAAYLSKILETNSNLTLLNLSILLKSHARGDEAEMAEHKKWEMARHLPLEALAENFGVFQNLTTLRLWLESDYNQPLLEQFTAAQFPNLQKLLLSGAVSPNLRLELPSLSTLKFRNCTLSSQNMHEILCSSTNLPLLADLELTSVDCDEWSAFERIQHTNLKHLRISLEDYHPKLAYYLHAGAGNSLKNLEGLYLDNCDIPAGVNPLGLMLNNEEDFKNLKYLSLIFNWDVPPSDLFIKIARACPDLELLELGDWFYETRDEAIEDDINLFEQRIVKYFDEIAVEDKKVTSLFGKIKMIKFVNVWSPDDDVPGISRVLCDHAKKLWPTALICGDTYI